MTDPKSSNKYLKYTGIAFQLAVLVAIAIWAGSKIDEKMQNEMPYMTALLVLLVFTGFMINLLRDLNSLS